MSLSALAVLASESGVTDGESHVNPYIFGAFTLLVFLLLLYGVTRLNLDR